MKIYRNFILFPIHKTFIWLYEDVGVGKCCWYLFTLAKLGQFNWSTLMLKEASCKLQAAQEPEGTHFCWRISYLLQQMGYNCKRVFSSHPKFSKNATVSITPNLAIRALSIKYRWKKTNCTVWLKITRRMCWG